MRLLRLLAFLSLVTAVPSAAQVQPVPGDGDPHLQVVDYQAGQVVQLRGSPGYQLMVELSPDEQIQNVALGDSGSWQVSINKAADRLFLKPVQAGSATNMTVVTSVRLYAFELVTVADATMEMPYTVQFRYPAPTSHAATAGNEGFVDVAAARRRLSQYRISGDRVLRPAAVTDDGFRTYIRWPKGAPIPAIYAIDPFGNEVLVNGMMGPDDIYVVDGTPQQLLFRIDREVAQARRVNPRKGR